ncbi:MAG: hypothetical protein CVV44_13885 [Spirochaetae bacterium HGW-Spirochaetae-1]|nr:MAG: hypothetical protein CVV44_13885 [Spirochaetae bacterium HGW-Spirochaetae-1]
MQAFESDSLMGWNIPFPDETVAQWQKIIDHLARVGNVPAVLIIRLHEDEGYVEVFKASRTPENIFHEGARMSFFHHCGLFCEEVISTGESLLVSDALHDDRWRGNPAVEQGMIAYLGLPLSYPDGSPFGALCVFDSKVNRFSEEFEQSVSQARDLLAAHLAIMIRDHNAGTMQLLKAVTENIPHAYISVIEKDLTVGYMTGGELRRWNLNPEAYAGKTLDEIFGEQTALVKEYCSKAFQGEEQTFEITIKNQHQMFNAVPLFSDEGSIDRVMAFAWNITKQKKAEEALRCALELNRLMDRASVRELLDFGLEEGVRLTGSEIGFFHLYNSEKKIIQLQTWSAKTRKSCSAQGEGMQYPLDSAGIWADCIHTGKPVINNNYVLSKGRKGLPDGHVPLRRFLSLPVMDRGDTVAIMGVGNKEEDYTDNEVDILSLLSDSLWNVVQRKRTEDEKESVRLQLMQAQKMEAVGNLAGGLVHDFNNVLNAISGSLEIIQTLLEKEVLSKGEKIERYIDMARTSFQRARDIISQLLMISKKQEQKLSPVDINLSLEHILNIAMNSFPKSVQLDFHLLDLPAYIHADETQIEQAFLNIAVNASHAMTIMRGEGEGEGGRMTVTIERREFDVDFCSLHPEADKGKAYVLISFTDTGVGMDEDVRLRIFEPFFSTKTDLGTGLGLSMVYSIIKMHKGFIDVYSEPGVGTVMRVYIPEYTVDDVRRIRREHQLQAVQGTGTILVVDDEKDMILIAEEFLRQCGYYVVGAEGALAGIDTFKKNHRNIDAVLLDLSMPVKSGVEMIRELQKIDPAVRVLLASGLSNDERIEKALKNGARGFIAKPYSKYELSVKMKEILE